MVTYNVVFGLGQTHEWPGTYFAPFVSMPQRRDQHYHRRFAALKSAVASMMSPLPYALFCDEATINELVRILNLAGIAGSLAKVVWIEGRYEPEGVVIAHYESSVTWIDLRDFE